MDVLEGRARKAAVFVGRKGGRGRSEYHVLSIPIAGNLGESLPIHSLLFYENGYAAGFSGNDKSPIPDECFDAVNNSLCIMQCRFCICMRDCPNPIIYRIVPLFPHPGKDCNIISVKKMA
ncbi:MAG: hypothetical protein NQU46_07670 [Methanolinea sp.]|nr:hypothetical protein [Methanolinea sp.]